MLHGEMRNAEIIHAFKMTSFVQEHTDFYIPKNLGDIALITKARKCRLNKGREEKALGLGGLEGGTALGLGCPKINHHSRYSWLVISLSTDFLGSFRQLFKKPIKLRKCHNLVRNVRHNK